MNVNNHHCLRCQLSHHVSLSGLDIVLLVYLLFLLYIYFILPDLWSQQWRLSPFSPGSKVSIPDAVCHTLSLPRALLT